MEAERAVAADVAEAVAAGADVEVADAADTLERHLELGAAGGHDARAWRRRVRGMTWVQTLLDGLVAGAIGGGVTLFGVRMALRHDREQATTTRITDAVVACMARLADTPTWNGLDGQPEIARFGMGMLRDLILIEGLSAGAYPNFAAVVDDMARSWGDVAFGDNEALGNFAGSAVMVFREWIADPHGFEDAGHSWKQVLEM